MSIIEDKIFGQILLKTIYGKKWKKWKEMGKMEKNGKNEKNGKKYSRNLEFKFFGKIKYIH